MSNQQPPLTITQPSKTLLTVLIEQGFLTREQAALLPQRADNVTIEQAIINRKLVKSEDIIRAYALLYDIPFVRLKKNSVPAEIVTMIPEVVARRFDVVAYAKEGDVLEVAISTPSKLKESIQGGLLHRLQSDLGIKIAPSFAPLEDIRSLFGHYAQAQKAAESTASELPTVDLTTTAIDLEALKKIPAEIASKYQFVAFAEPQPQKLALAIIDPSNPEMQQLLQFIQEKNDISVLIYRTDAKSLAYAISQYPGASTDDASIEISKESDVSEAVQVQPASVSVPIQSTPAVPIAVEVPVQPKAVKVDPAFLETRLPHEKETTLPGVATAPVVATQISSAPAVGENEISIVNQIHSEVPVINNRDLLTSPILPSNREIVSTSGDTNLDTIIGEPITSLDQLVKIVKSGNVPKMVAAMLAFAIITRASDIHIEATKEQLRLRYRIDGELTDILLLPVSLLAPIVSRIKILSELKIDENRIPQDGRFNLVYREHEIDIRVSTLPTVHGEKVVMRILDKTTGILTLGDMGLDGISLERIERNITKPYGIILSTGPTGSGKSTTLYAALRQISTPEVNIVTLEDPVEYEIKGVNQTQIKPKIGFTFAEGLRSILRQDPNVIMVGEIRDAETAEMATHAALTGHLVLSTLHTNTAAGGLPRLINMGVEPFLITSSINAVIGQRLVRRICEKCKIEDKVPQDVVEEINKELMNSNVPEEFKDPTRWKFYKGQGCPACTNGYRGRIGIFEVLEMTEAIEELAIKKAPESAMEDQAIKEGMITMKQDGLLKALMGLTTLEEVFKASTE